jgi:hypothetical protein
MCWPSETTRAQPISGARNNADRPWWRRLAWLTAGLSSGRSPGIGGPGRWGVAPVRPLTVHYRIECEEIPIPSNFMTAACGVELIPS